MTTTQELLKSSFELNLNNYGPEDVERLNDRAIKAYAALEALQAEVKHLNLHLKATQSGRDAALARLAELTKQERIGVVSETWARWPDKGNVVVVDWVKDTPPIGASIYAAAGASPVEPSESAEHWHSLYIKKCQELHDEKAWLGAEIETLELAVIDDA